MLQVILIVLVVAMMVGPIFMMRPSGRDQREAKLRAIAREVGLSVHLSARPGASDHTNIGRSVGSGDGQMFAVYMLPWSAIVLSRDDKMPSWTVEQKEYEHEIHLQGAWDWLNGCKSPESWVAAIKVALDSLPKGVVALSSTQAGIGVYWDESLRGKTSQQAVGDIRQTLEELRRSIGA